ncbi:MAG: caspase family protein [Bacteroidetes bacterium]|nr:caspase family protein [Bacteroidota bacterium]
MKKIFLNIIFFLIVQMSFCQYPSVVLQRPFEYINNIYENTARYFIVEEGPVKRNYSIWEQDSKIMLGSLVYFPGNGQGSGVVRMMGDGRILISGNHNILKADLINHDTSTFINIIQYPEYHLAYNFLPWDSTKLIMATKIYPKPGRVYDVTDQGRLLIYDTVQRKVILTQSVNFEITLFSFIFGKKQVWAGTNHGEAILYDSALNMKTRISLFHGPLRYLYQVSDSLLIANENDDPIDHSYTRGKGALLFYNLGEKKKRVVSFSEQVSPLNDKSFGADNAINSILVDKTNKNVIVNYGYSMIEKVSYTTFNRAILKTPDFQKIAKIIFNGDSSQLIICGGKFSLMPNINKICYYDLRKNRVLYSLKNFRTPVKNKQSFCEIFPDSNTYFITRKNELPKMNADTVMLYSFHDKPRKLIFRNCWVQLYPNSTIISIYNYAYCYHLNLNSKLINRSLYDIDMNKMDQQPPAGSNSFPFSIVEKLVFKDYTFQDEVMDLVYSPQTFTTVIISRSFSESSGLNWTSSVVRNKKEIYKYSFNNDISGLTRVSADGKFLAYSEEMKANSAIQKLNLVDLSKGKVIFSQRFKDGSLKYSDFDINNPSCYYVTQKGDEASKLYRINPEKKELKEELVNDQSDFYDIIVNENEDMIACGLYDEYFIEKLSTHERLYTKKLNKPVNEILYSKSLKAFGYATDDGLSLIRDKSLQLAFYEFNDFHFSVISNRGYYFSDKDALQNFGFVYNRKGYRISDFDLYFNRPDLIYQYLDGSNREFRKLLDKSIEKRLKYFGKKQSAAAESYFANLPEAYFSSKSKLPDFSNDSILDVGVTLVSKGTPLEKFHLDVNGNPLFGHKGYSLNCDSCPTWSGTFPVSLVNGKNLIQISAEDKNGKISARESIEIICEKPIAKPDLIFIPISVSIYLDERYNLKYSVKDGKDMQHLFSSFSSTYNVITDYAYFDKDATRENIMKISERLKSSKPADCVILYVSGHGLLDKNSDFYFATYDMDFSNPSSRGISFSELESLLDSIPAGKKLFLMDACHSGVVDKEDVAVSFIAGKQTEVNQDVKTYTTKGNTILGDGVNPAAVQTSFELMQDLFASINQGSGAVIISAAAGNSYALESQKWNNGVFTYAIINGLKNREADLNKDGSITVSELRNYVIDQVQTLTEGRQKPTCRQENVEFDWKIW